MKKFEYSTEDGKVDLEVVRLATYTPGYLNKQIIIILWANGIPETTFLKLQKDYVDDLVACFHLKSIGVDYEFRKDIFQS